MLPTVRAVLFDMGGTLDGDGVHWLDRFSEAYAAAGVPMEFERLREAFDAAERRASIDEAMPSAGLTAMVARHLSWQFDHLGIADTRQLAQVASHVDARLRETARRHRPLLAALDRRRLRLGVVSNGCGNVRALCDDFEYSPLLAVVVDSRAVGVAKPDPRIYTMAADALALPPADILMVGDSFDRDVVPAKTLGMQTAWLHGARPCADPSRVDLMLDSLVDLPTALDRLGWIAA